MPTIKPKFRAKAAPKAPEISVIVPVYNAEFHLIDAIDSIYAQDLPKGFAEILVVDDKYKDGDLAAKAQHERVLRELKRRMNARMYPNLKLMDSAENGINNGQSIARNTGIKAAQAPYIACLDADDMYAYDPSRLERYGSVLERAVKTFDQNDSVAIVQTRVMLFGSGQRHRYIYPEGPTLDRIKDMVLMLNMGNANVFRREDAIAAGGYNPNHSTREDSPFFVSIINARHVRGKESTVETLANYDYLYRQHFNPNSHVHGQDFNQEDQDELLLETIKACKPVYAHYFGSDDTQELFTAAKQHTEQILKNMGDPSHPWYKQRGFIGGAAFAKSNRGTLTPCAGVVLGNAVPDINTMCIDPNDGLPPYHTPD